MSDTFPLAKKIGIVQPAANLDYRYGPWPTVQRALEITAGLRELGLTVAVSSISTGAIEYHFKNGITDSDLIVKSVDLSGYLPLSGGTLTGNISTNNIIYAKGGNSDQWNSVYSNVNLNSGKYESVYSFYNGQSSLDTQVRSFVNLNSANINEVTTKVNNTSGNWESGYFTWNSLSAGLVDAETFSENNSSTFIQVRTEVLSKSANWNSNYATWNNLSAGIIDTRTFNNDNSSTFIQVRTEVLGQSGNNRSGYATWNSLSAGLIDARTFNNNNSSTFIQVRTEVFDTSSNNRSGYNTWNSLSAGIVDARTFNNNNSSTFIQVRTEVLGQSANNRSVYSTYNANSGLYATKQYTVDNFLALSGGYVSGDVSIAGNLFLLGSATQISTEDLVLTNSLIYLASGNPSDIVDIGFVGYTSSIDLGQRYTGLVRDSGTKKWVLFSQLSSVSASDININDISLTVDTLRANLEGNLTTNTNVFGSLSASGNINGANLRINDWNTAFNQSTIYSNNSSKYESVYSNFNNNSSTFIQIRTEVFDTSANNRSGYTTWNNLSAGIIDTRTFNNDNSSTFIQVRTEVLSQSANNRSGYATWNSLSAGIIDARTFNNNNSSTFIQVRTEVLGQSANNRSNYATWNSLSTGLVDARTFNNNNSSTFIQVRTEVLGQSANNRSVYGTFNTNSGKYESVYSNVNNLSTNWQSVYSNVNNLSTNWESVYGITNTNSGKYESVYSNVNILSTDWNSVYSNVNILSTDWNSVYSTFNSNSSEYESVYSNVNNLSTNWQSVYGITNTNSGKYESVYSNVNNLSTNWQSNYSTWNSSSARVVDSSTLVNNNSSNWNSIYTIVSGTSSSWSSLGTLTNTIVTDLSVGAITAAQVLPAGTTFQQFAEALLTKIYYPTFTNRSLTVTSNHGGNGTNVEIGTQSVTLTLTYTRGQIRGKTVNLIWDPNFLQGYRTGIANDYVIFGNVTALNSATSASALIIEGSNTYNVTCNYAIGDQPVDSRNNPYLTPEPASSVSTSMTLNGRRRAFFGADTTTTAPTDSNGVRGLPQNLLNPSNGSTFTVNIAAGARRIIIAYPSTLQNVTQIYYPPLQSDIKNEFILSTVSVSGANSLFPTNYKVYSYIPLIAFAAATTVQVTI